MKLLIIIITSFLSFIVHCSNPTESKNNPPEIIEIILNPATPKTDQRVILNAIAVDKDGDELVYNWSVTNGELENSGIGNPINWTTPSIETSIDLTCIVNDGKETATKTKNITIQIQTGIIKGYIFEEGTNNPIGGVDVRIENYNNNISGPHGYFELVGIKVGERIIWAIKSGYNTYSDTIYVNSGVNNLDIYLEKG